MSEFLTFIGRIGNELYDLFVYAKSGNQNPEEEKRIAAKIIRKAVDEEAKQEIEG